MLGRCNQLFNEAQLCGDQLSFSSSPNLCRLYPWCVSHNWTSKQLRSLA